MRRRWKGPAPPDSGIRTGGVRDRALRAVQMRGPVPEDIAKTRASQEYWRQFREGQKLLARAEQEGTHLGRSSVAEIVEIVIKKTPLPAPHVIVTTKVADPHRLQPFQTFRMDDSTGEVTDITCFASVAAALMHHDRRVRAALVEETTG